MQEAGRWRGYFLPTAFFTEADYCSGAAGGQPTLAQSIKPYRCHLLGIKPLGERAEFITYPRFEFWALCGQGPGSVTA